ncbi:WD40 repeat domain-containing protein [Streptomyces sp. HUAS TT20]|uniref:WD40 repeat domain-containing protein n=1 Tax=Streptomyces sp. HUAS TT20 TaxID=3447509 RepID=UPI0021DB07A1|nr:WD40 repeat domain-containing protein [Streptomyces sp. HUAS 15-9]UXY26834.1 WD40 repeat domain-containing protein [Streptomyces sp. HUAS 15-9]
MNVEELVRDALREQAAEQQPLGHGFTDRVLAVRRRRRARRFVSVAVATAAVVVVAVGVPLLDSGRGEARPARVLGQDRVSAHQDQSPPRDMIAAGNAVLAAYSTASVVPQTGDRGVVVRTYRLLNEKVGRYEKDTRWSYVAVAPGLRTAAVLERKLPASRIGLLDLATGEVERWIPVAHGVGGLAFSRDGSKLVATTYKDNPDLVDKTMVHGKGGSHTAWMPRLGGKVRTGFVVLDVASGKGSWTGVAAGRNLNAREDFAFSRDGALVYARVVGKHDGTEQFYDLAGKEVPAPANEKYLRWDVGARLSPNGRLAALGLTKEVAPGKSYSSIRDPRTGKEITKVRGGHLLAWADDKRLIAWERVTSLEEPYRPRLVLVTIGSDKVVPLSGVSEVNDPFSLRTWEPVFAER